MDKSIVHPVLWLILDGMLVGAIVGTLTGLFLPYHKEKKEQPIETIRIESPESKLTMVAMRCQKMEQDNDMLRFRIGKLEDTIAEMTNSSALPVTEKQYIYITNAVDDLID